MSIENYSKKTDFSLKLIISEEKKFSTSLCVLAFYGFLSISEIEKSDCLIITISDLPIFFENCLKITKYFSKSAEAKDESNIIFERSESKIFFDCNKKYSEKNVTFYETRINSTEKRLLFELNISKFTKFLKALKISILSMLDLNIEEKLVFESILTDNSTNFKELQKNSVSFYSRLLFLAKSYNLDKKAITNCLEIFQFYEELFDILYKLKSLYDMI